MNPADVTVVVPAMNEAAAIADVVATLRNELPEAELIVVNDGSTDATADLAAGAGARVITHDRRRGYGSALRTGTQAATREYVLFCDADGQHSASDAARVIAACDGCAMVVGARGKDSHTPFIRAPGKAQLPSGSCSAYSYRQFVNTRPTKLRNAITDSVIAPLRDTN